MTEARRRHVSGGTAKAKSISEKEGPSAGATGKKSVPVTSARKPQVGIFLHDCHPTGKRNLDALFSRQGKHGEITKKIENNKVLLRETARGIPPVV